MTYRTMYCQVGNSELLVTNGCHILFRFFLVKLTLYNMYISIPCDILDFYGGLFIKCVEMPQYWEVPSPCLMID